MLLKHYLTAFESWGGLRLKGGGVDNLHSGSLWRYGARRPFSHKFVLVYFNHFEKISYAWFIEYYNNGEIMISYHNALLHVYIGRYMIQINTLDFSLKSAWKKLVK